MSISETHFVLNSRVLSPFPLYTSTALFGMGCFWGAERLFWQLAGVYSTMVGYSGGNTERPSYREVCSGTTGHCEVVQVIYDSSLVSYMTLLKTFWEGHNPTQGMQQGNDVGTQYRSAIFTFSDDQRDLALQSRLSYDNLLSSAGLGKITTEITPAAEFYYAEDYHQQYLAKNPDGYCGLGGTGIEFILLDDQPTQKR